jgi:hypothetical protein
VNKEHFLPPGGNVTFGWEPLFLKMSSESIREKIRQIGKFPGLSESLEKQVRLLRCQDISKDEFLSRVERMQDRAETLFEGSLPESMDEETYLVAQEYYDKASESLDCYLSGLDALVSWVHSGNNAVLEQARHHFVRGDKTTEEVIMLAFEAQESFKEADEALMRSLGVDPEGIN